LARGAWRGALGAWLGARGAWRLSAVALPAKGEVIRVIIGFVKKSPVLPTKKMRGFVKFLKMLS
jgi:hypothetical protein